MSSVLSVHDLPAVELQAGVLDGELVRVGAAYCATDTIIGSEHRAAAIAAEVPPWSIAERFTAAWVYGVVDRHPTQLHMCVNHKSKVRPFSTARLVYREVVIGEHETRRMGGLAVTTPLRTALDIARIETRFSEEHCRILRALCALGEGFTLADCRAQLRARAHLPHKQVALTRLSLALGERTRDYPELTRYTSYT